MVGLDDLRGLFQPMILRFTHWIFHELQVQISLQSFCPAKPWQKHPGAPKPLAEQAGPGSSEHSPFGLLHLLQVEEQRGHDFVHVLWVPDVGLELVVHRLPHHPLQAFNAGHPDPEEQIDIKMLHIHTAYVILHLYTHI